MRIQHCRSKRLRSVHVGDGMEEAAALAELGEVGAREEVEHSHPHLPRQTQLVCLFIVAFFLFLGLYRLQFLTSPWYLLGFYLR
jgi:hypothetical protein